MDYYGHVRNWKKTMRVLDSQRLARLKKENPEDYNRMGYNFFTQAIQEEKWNILLRLIPLFNPTPCCWNKEKAMKEDHIVCLIQSGHTNEFELLMEAWEADAREILTCLVKHHYPCTAREPCSDYLLALQRGHLPCFLWRTIELRKKRNKRVLREIIRSNQLELLKFVLPQVDQIKSVRLYRMYRQAIKYDRPKIMGYIGSLYELQSSSVLEFDYAWAQIAVQYQRNSILRLIVQRSPTVSYPSVVRKYLPLAYLDWVYQFSRCVGLLRRWCRNFRAIYYAPDGPGFIKIRQHFLHYQASLR